MSEKKSPAKKRGPVAKDLKPKKAAKGGSPVFGIRAMKTIPPVPNPNPP